MSKKITELDVLAVLAAEDILTLVDFDDLADSPKQMDVESFFRNIPVNVGIGIAAPVGTLHVYGANDTLYLDAPTASDTALKFRNDGVFSSAIYRPAGTDNLFISVGATAIVSIPTSLVGIGITAPLAKTHIDQSDNAAAIPVLALDQADISEGFINFIGSDRGVITGVTNSTASVRVETGGVVHRLALYADA